MEEWKNKGGWEKGRGGTIRKKPKKIGFGKRSRFKWSFWVSREKQLMGGWGGYPVQDNGGAGRPDRDDRFNNSGTTSVPGARDYPEDTCDQGLGRATQQKLGSQRREAHSIWAQP